MAESTAQRWLDAIQVKAASPANIKEIENPATNNCVQLSPFNPNSGKKLATAQTAMAVSVGRTRTLDMAMYRDVAEVFFG